MKRAFLSTDFDLISEQESYIRFLPMLSKSMVFSYRVYIQDNQNKVVFSAKTASYRKTWIFLSLINYNTLRRNAFGSSFLSRNCLSRESSLIGDMTWFLKWHDSFMTHDNNHNPNEFIELFKTKKDIFTSFCILSNEWKLFVTLLCDLDDFFIIK